MMPTSSSHHSKERIYPVLRWFNSFAIVVCCVSVLYCSGGNNPSEQPTESSQTEQISQTEQLESVMESAADASTQDSSSEQDNTCPPDLPKPSRACLTGCGNELRVGMPCTRGGQECNNNPKTFLCTGDFDDKTDLLFCTKPCVVDEDCGSGAKCAGDPKKPTSGRGCIPAACL